MTYPARPLPAPPERPAANATLAPTAVRETVRAAAVRPWFRREPWMAVMVVAYVVMGAGFALPTSTHLVLLGLSGLLAVSSIGLLIRQGPFREAPPGPDASSNRV